VTLNVLLLSEGSYFAYRVLKTAGAAGARVHVLASRHARALRWSRRAASFALTDAPFDLADCEALVDQINRIIVGRKIDCVLAGDAPTTRFMIGVAPRLVAPIFPSPDLATFDLLNDKSRFTELATSLGLECPPTRLFKGREELAQALKSGKLPFPGIVKPLSQSGGEGVRRIDGADWATVLNGLNYAPILWQRFIPDLQWDVSAFCRDGAIVAFSLRRRAKGEVVFAESHELRRQAGLFAQRLNVSGILDFDIIADEALTRFTWLECNPRVFFTIDLVAAAGTNMIAVGLDATDRAPAAAAPVRRIRQLRGMIGRLMRGRPLAWRDLRLLLADLSDPVMFLKVHMHELISKARSLMKVQLLGTGGVGQAKGAASEGHRKERSRNRGRIPDCGHTNAVRPLSAPRPAGLPKPSGQVLDPRRP